MESNRINSFKLISIFLLDPNTSSKENIERDDLFRNIFEEFDLKERKLNDIAENDKD